MVVLLVWLSLLADVLPVVVGVAVLVAVDVFPLVAVRVFSVVAVSVAALVRSCERELTYNRSAVSPVSRKLAL